MATMTIRTTVAFDPATVARWERLAKRWGTTKSEALRRALETAEELNISTSAAPPGGPEMPSPQAIRNMSPQEALAWLRDHSLVTPAQGRRWLRDIRETREDFAARP